MLDNVTPNSNKGLWFREIEGKPYARTCTDRGRVLLLAGGGEVCTRLRALAIMNSIMRFIDGVDRLVVVVVVTQLY